MRDESIDVLRVLGTILVIFAHMDLPNFISNIRTFDVVLLIIISGISYVRSNNDNCSIKEYLIKRTKKLVCPTYVCMFFIFISAYIACIVLGRSQLFSTRTIFMSLIFSNEGIGYIWIVKIYIIIALLSRSLYKVTNYLKNDFLFVFVLCLLIILQHELLNIDILRISFVFRNYLFYIIPYSVAILIGMRWAFSNMMFKNTIICVLALAFGIITINNGFHPAAYKYPPDFQYLVYGLFISSLLLRLNITISSNFITQVSKNSFVIYLFHIIFLMSYNFMVKFLNIGILNNYMIKFLVVISLSIFFTHIYSVNIKGDKEKWI